MIQVDNYLKDIPSVMTEDTYKNRLRVLLEKVARNEPIKTSEDIKGYASPEAKTKLIKYFKGKCAFCECDTKSGARYDTEHFRPKIIYLWLAYEWSNFLLSCQRCNREFKTIKFPIKKIAAIIPIIDFNDEKSKIRFYENCYIESEILKKEEPLLLHPVLDNDPDSHLEFKENGEVVGKTEKGKVSIEIYGLNDKENRKDLIKDRESIVKQIKKDVLAAVERYKIGNNKDVLYNDLLNLQLDLKLVIEKKEAPFIALRRTCLEKFQSFFIDQFIGSPYGILLKQTFEDIENDLKALD